MIEEKFKKLMEKWTGKSFEYLQNTPICEVRKDMKEDLVIKSGNVKLSTTEEINKLVDNAIKED